ncbi:hypothetical protein FACS1894200_06870 [Spirochaetia bacterium]|nr:hypothetical protein FACS1894200_06870 [Spirochaetia bacterium]
MSDLQAGTYTVRMSYAGNQKEERTVTVTANGTATAVFSYRVAAAPQPPPPNVPAPVVTAPSAGLNVTAPTVTVPVKPLPPDMVRIRGGTFTMGSPASEPGRDSDEGPQHQVTVSGFSIGKYEVTVANFRAFVQATGYKTDAETSGGAYIWTNNNWVQKADANWKNPYFTQTENSPVTCVSWNDAVNYCNWKSGQDGLTPAYTISGTNVTWNRR